MEYLKKIEDGEAVTRLEVDHRYNTKVVMKKLVSSLCLHNVIDCQPLTNIKLIQMIGRCFPSAKIYTNVF